MLVGSNYVKAFTYRPLRALVGDGLLTSEGEAWRHHRRLIQPVFSRREVAGFGPPMTAAARRLVPRWDRLADGSLVNVAAEMSALTLEIVGLALLGADLTGDAEQLGRAMSAGQRAVVLTALLPIRWGPASTRVVKAATRRIGRTPEGVEGPATRVITGTRVSGRTRPGLTRAAFAPGGAGQAATRHRYAFIPFGGDRRACVGASFAELETVLVLGTIARRFRLELTAGGMPAPRAHVTLRPGRNLPMHLRHRA